jgi:type IV pilus assembly protein PilV
MLTMTRSNENGFSLIEVLVAVVILAVGLLGLANLQATSLKYNHSAYLRSQATLLSYDIIDRIRVNKGSINNYLTTDASSANAQSSCLSSGCTTVQMAENDLYEWNQTIQQTLPNGIGSVTQAGETYTVDIGWDDNRDGEINGDDPDFRVSFTL